MNKMAYEVYSIYLIMVTNKKPNEIDRTVQAYYTNMAKELLKK